MNYSKYKIAALIIVPNLGKRKFEMKTLYRNGRICCSICALLLLITTSAYSDAPDNTFKKANGTMHCEAGVGGSACRGHGTLTINLDPGKTLDKSFHQGSKPCCGGHDNRNGASTVIPDGVYVEFDGGNEGEWGVFNIRLVADSSNIDDKGIIRAWTVEADTYCGPTARLGGGGCNVTVYAWIKQK